MHLSRDVFPDPLGPMNVVMRPLAIVIETFCKIGLLPMARDTLLVVIMVFLSERLFPFMTNERDGRCYCKIDECNA